VGLLLEQPVSASAKQALAVMVPLLFVMVLILICDRPRRRTSRRVELHIGLRNDELVFGGRGVTAECASSFRVVSRRRRT
jgi:hypothetical protein